MDNLHNDERISAYLDGELTADEQVRFEGRLAESAELRQLVEELRSLRASLDLLPRHRLEADFADHVLRRAEREMLTAGDGASGSVPTEGVGHAVRAVVSAGNTASPGHTGSAALGEPRNWKRRAFRPLIYAAAAIAAAVLIMVFNPPRDKDVAQVGDNAKPARLPEGAVASSKSGGGPAAPGAAGEAGRPRADDQTKFEALAQTKGAPAASGGSADFSDENHRRTGGQPELAKQDGISAGSPAGNIKNGEETSKTNNLTQSLERAEQGQVKRELNLGQDMAKTPPGASPNQMARDSGGQGRVLRSKIEAEGAEKAASSGRESHLAETAASAPVQNAPAAPPEGTAKGSLSTDLAVNERDPTKEVLRRSGAAPAGMVIANCIATPDAAQDVFFRLLAKNNIAVDPLSVGAPTTHSATLDRVAKESGELADKDQLLRTGDKAAEAKRSLGEIEKAKDKPRDVEVIYVEGTADQITSLMNDLRAEPEVFRLLTVAPAPTFPIASYAYDGSFAKDHRPLDLQFGGYKAGGKPAPRDAELHESLREREVFGATTKSETPPPVPAKAPAENELSDHLTSDEKSIEGLGAKVAATDKTRKDQLKQMEPAGAALADKPSSLVGKPMKSAETGAPNVSAQYRSLAPQRPIGETTLPLSGTASRAPAGPAAAPSAPAAPIADAVSPSQPPAAFAAPGGASRTMTHAEADAKSIDWGDKQAPARTETAGPKQQPSTPLGHAVRLDSWSLASPPVQLDESRKAGAQKADDAPTNAPALPADAGSVARGAGASPTDRSAVKKDEGKPSPTNRPIPSIEATGDRTMLRSDPKSSPKEADVEFRAASPRMQAIFVFRLEPAPAAAAAVASPAQPPAARPPAAGGAAPAAKEKK